MSEEIVAKAKISTSLGTFEFEGTSDFVGKQIADITTKFSGKALQPFQSDTSGTIKLTEKEGSESVQKSKVRKLTVQQPKLLSGLITDSAKIKELKDFVSSKKPNGHLERFLVLTYWLKTNLSVEEVSIDEMWTTYKMLSEKAPRILIQVFRDAKSKKGWFTAGSGVGKYQITSIGETFVEHDLPNPNSKS